MKVMVVIPVYNHAATLRRVVEGLLPLGLDILVVDDGSTDDPLGQLAGLPVQTLRHETNRGKGRALRTGAAYARARGFDAVLTLDADGQHRPEEAPRLLEAAAAHWPTFVVGVRDMEGPDVPNASRKGRRFSNYWVWVETGRRLGDTQSGFRVYPTAFLGDCPFAGMRYTFEVEVLVKALWAGWRIVDVPISVIYPPAGKRITHFRLYLDTFRFTVLHHWLTFWAILGCRRWRTYRIPR